MLSPSDDVHICQYFPLTKFLDYLERGSQSWNVLADCFFFSLEIESHYVSHTGLRSITSLLSQIHFSNNKINV